MDERTDFTHSEFPLCERIDRKSVLKLRHFRPPVFWRLRHRPSIDTREVTRPATTETPLPPPHFIDISCVFLTPQLSLPPSLRIRLLIRNHFCSLSDGHPAIVLNVSAIASVIPLSINFSGPVMVFIISVIASQLTLHQFCHVIPTSLPRCSPGYEWRSWENAWCALARVPVLSADKTLQQGCGHRFLTVVDDDTNVDCGGRVVLLSARETVCFESQMLNFVVGDTASASSLHFSSF